MFLLPLLIIVCFSLRVDSLSSLCCYCASLSEATTYTKGLYVKETAIKHSKHPQIECVEEVVRSQRQPEPRIYTRTPITLLVVSKAHRCDSKKEKKDVFPNFLNYNLCIISMLYVSVYLYLLSILLCVYAPPGEKHNPSLNPPRLLPVAGFANIRIHHVKDEILFYYFNYISK